MKVDYVVLGGGIAGTCRQQARAKRCDPGLGEHDGLPLPDAVSIARKNISSEDLP